LRSSSKGYASRAPPLPRPTAIADERHQPFLELACGDSVAEKVHHAGVAPIASDTAIGSLDRTALSFEHLSEAMIGRE
jgi:hypothetical protein